MENDYLALEKVDYMLKDTKLIQKPEFKKFLNKKFTNESDMDALKNRKRDIVKSLKFYLGIVSKLQIKFGYDDNIDLIQNSPYPIRPFQNSGSICFFYYVKAGDLENVHKLLEKNPFFVYEYDEFRQTALHIAVRKENQKLVELLLNYKPDVNFKDNLYRSPLYHALQSKSYQLSLILFVHGAQPWSSINCNYGEMQINPRQKLILKKARLAGISIMLSKDKTIRCEKLRELINN